MGGWVGGLTHHFGRDFFHRDQVGVEELEEEEEDGVGGGRDEDLVLVAFSHSAFEHGAGWVGGWVGLGGGRAGGWKELLRVAGG